MISEDIETETHRATAFILTQPVSTPATRSVMSSDKSTNKQALTAQPCLFRGLPSEAGRTQERSAAEGMKEAALPRQSEYPPRTPASPLT